MGSLLWTFVLCGLLAQDVLSEYPRSGYQRLQTSEYTNNQSNRYKYYNADNRLPPPVTKTEFGFHTVKTGTTYLNPGQKGPPYTDPDETKTQYYFVTKNQTTFHVPGRSHRKLPNDLTPAIQRPNHRHRSGPECLRCPPEKIMIARKGLDGVLVEPPKLVSCHNRPILNGAYEIETLFGPHFKFLLPHGTHSLHAKIRNKRTGRHLQTCILRYKVVVQQCGRYYPNDENLRMKCDLGYIWGSKCYFNCRIGYLSHKRPMVCGDSLKWEGDEPECSPIPPKLNKTCDFLVIPDNGRFACEYPKGVKSQDFDNELLTPEGSICRVICNRNYEIPPALEPYSVLRCQNGRWNNTAHDLCRPNNRQRY